MGDKSAPEKSSSREVALARKGFNEKIEKEYATNHPSLKCEPMFEEDYKAKKDIFDIFSKGLQSYYQGDFEKALAIFMTLEDQDAPARSYVEKCRELIAEKPESWDGTWVMTKK